MAGEKITQRILDAARAEAQETLAQGKKNIGELLDKSRREIDAKLKLIDDETDELCAEVRRRSELLTNLDTRKAELASRREVLNEAYELALKSLCGIDEARWEKLVTKLIAENVETGHEKLRLNKKDAERFASLGLLDKLNAELKAKAREGALTLDSQYADIKGGVLIVSDTCETDCSFEAVVRDMRSGSEKEVAALLFGAGV